MDEEVKQYLTFKLEASPSITRVYGDTIKPGNVNSSYSKFSGVVNEVEVESCKDIMNRTQDQKKLENILGLKLDSKTNEYSYDFYLGYCFNTSKLLGIGVELWEEDNDWEPLNWYFKLEYCHGKDTCKNKTEIE